MNNYDYKMESIIHQMKDKYDTFTNKERLDYAIICYYFSEYAKEPEVSKVFYSDAQLSLEKFLKENKGAFIPVGSSYGLVMIAYLSRALNHDHKYDTLLHKIEEKIRNESLSLINSYDYVKQGMMVGVYDLLNGISSILNYSLDYIADIQFNARLLKWLIAITLYKKTADDKLFPALIIKEENITNPKHRKCYYDGYIDMGLSHGIIAILHVLGKAKLHGYKIKDLEKAMCLIQQLYENAKVSNETTRYPAIFSVHKKEFIYDKRMSWCYGSLGSINTLYLVSKAVNNKQLEIEKRKDLCNLIQYQPSTMKLLCPTFCHGISGLYLILHLANLDMHAKHIDEYIKDIEQQIWDMGAANNTYYFDTIIDTTTKEELLNMGVIDGIGSILIPYMIRHRKIRNNFMLKLLFLELE